MSLKNATFKVDSTAISATGGTSETLKSISDDGSSHKLYFGSDNFLTRHNVEFSITSPQVSATAPNGFTQERCRLVQKVPMTLTNGNTTTLTVRSEVSTDVETTTAQKLELVRTHAQFLGGADFADFWANQQLDG
jgi:hypothetical protein